MRKKVRDMWLVLLCLALMPADDVRCLAADSPAVQASAAPALHKVEPLRAIPPTSKGKPAAKTGSLLGAIFDSIGGGGPGNPVAAQAIEDQNIRNLGAQFRPQFEQLLYVELAFLRRVCKPDAKPFADVAKAAKADLDVPLREYVLSCYGLRQRTSARLNAVDPRSEVEKLLMSLVEAKLGPEKARLYRQECDQRAEARKHAAVLNVVAALDDRLVLNPQQRAKLVQSLSANYEHAWDQFLERFPFGNQNYLPSIRDESIVPLLDERQKSEWGQAIKLNGQVFFGRVLPNRLGLAGDATEMQEIAHIAEEVQYGQ